ncbi:MAG: hypothetical protein ACJAVS_000509 [Paracoccaceae bacterium]
MAGVARQLAACGGPLRFKAPSNVSAGIAASAMVRKLILDLAHKSVPKNNGFSDLIELGNSRNVRTIPDIWEVVGYGIS